MEKSNCDSNFLNKAIVSAEVCVCVCVCIWVHVSIHCLQITVRVCRVIDEAPCAALNSQLASVSAAALGVWQFELLQATRSHNGHNTTSVHVHTHNICGYLCSKALKCGSCSSGPRSHANVALATSYNFLCHSTWGYFSLLCCCFCNYNISTRRELLMRQLIFMINFQQEFHTF